MKATSIFIVDDHYLVIEGIRSLLQNERELLWSGHAMNAASCLAFLQSNQPDVILMDISMPDMSGIDLCKIVKKRYPSVSVIALSTFNQLSFIQKMMDNGASGYVLKNATRDELLQAIATVMKGGLYVSDEVAKTMRQPDQEKVVLTRREKEVLALIAEGLTNQEIAKQLFVSVTTVDTHRKNLLAKFEVKNTATLINRATKAGLI